MDEDGGKKEQNEQGGSGMDTTYPDASRASARAIAIDNGLLD